MTVVGEINQKRAIRQHINPMDKSTIVSIFPREIDEVKPTIQPGRFIIAPGSYDKPSMLVIGSSSWWLDIPTDDRLVEIPQSSIQVADAIVKDYMNGMLACDMSGATPGLFFITGEVDENKLFLEYKGLLDGARIRQDNWYRKLIDLASALWARSNGNPLTIDDNMRLAAREMKEDYDWANVTVMRVEKVPCVACGAPRDPKYPVCATCGNVNVELAAKMGLKFATK